MCCGDLFDTNRRGNRSRHALRSYIRHCRRDFQRNYFGGLCGVRGGRRIGVFHMHLTTPIHSSILILHMHWTIPIHSIIIILHIHLPTHVHSTIAPVCSTSIRWMTITRCCRSPLCHICQSNRIKIIVHFQQRSQLHRCHRTELVFLQI